MKIQTEKASLVGSIVSGVLASICCIGPIVFALLGITGAGFVLKLEAFRPIFIVVALSFLSVSGYLTFRKKPVEQCEPGSLCVRPGASQRNKISFFVSAVIVALAVLFPNILSMFI